MKPVVLAAPELADLAPFEYHGLVAAPFEHRGSGEAAGSRADHRDRPLSHGGEAPI